MRCPAAVPARTFAAGLSACQPSLHNDLVRFTFLLGGDDGEALFGHHEQ
jgi:hypothetical protein